MTDTRRFYKEEEKEKEMSTHSRIGIEEVDGTIRSVYCHFDGYEEHVGALLLKAYTDPNKLRALISLGDLSSLAEGLEKTVAYHRDRGEDLNVQTGMSRREFDRSESFAYLFVVATGEWIYTRGSEKNCVTLTEKICSRE